MGTPKRQLKAFEAQLLDDQEWAEVQPGVEVKMVAHPDGGAGENDHAIHEGVVTAAHCFGWVAAGGKRDILIREEAVRNGRFGVLAVFSMFELP